MGFLKLADKTAVKRYTHPEHEDAWVELREHLTKAEMNFLLRSTPDSMIEADENRRIAVLKDATGMAETLFGVMVVSWSLDSQPTVENYLALDPDAGNWIDGVLYGHLNNMSMSKEEQGKPSTSPRESRKVARETI